MSWPRPAGLTMVTAVPACADFRIFAPKVLAYWNCIVFAVPRPENFSVNEPRLVEVHDRLVAGVVPVASLDEVRSMPQTYTYWPDGGVRVIVTAVLIAAVPLIVEQASRCCGARWT